MRFVLFYHSLVSDWNHGNAHFLRGVVTELIDAGHQVTVYEPAGGWSRRNLLRDEGIDAIESFRRAYPRLRSRLYDVDAIDLDEVLDGADVVIVHEWNAPELVGRIGRHRARGARYLLLFHDTHHRSATATEDLARFELDAYDGVLAFGEVVRERYLARGWSSRAWTWHEAADTRVFRPMPEITRTADLVWIGNWGDEERSAELREYLMRPSVALHLSTTVYGVRYPATALEALRTHGIEYGGWLANHAVPHVFAKHRVTVHIPRRPYVRALPGIPTIRVFEALACGIPLVCAPWTDTEGLFRPRRDFLVAEDPEAMERCLQALMADADQARDLAVSGLETITRRHTCRHRVDELLGIVDQIRGCDPRLDPRRLEATK